ncbi:PAS domain S-box protein [Anaerobacillus sp. CMMVII]|uniref:PAS domain S-box protein n=1 Tax=Anaerobacillus sp. CMMVII TaxID=2755588 RepID=UPI0021B76241|nr:PAS domain S-box protein [Anaerobacillus sp. CMMVII]MCT8137776.1 PAS domain S-box protein [Anaerobacillus sp. CMMVII]
MVHHSNAHFETDKNTKLTIVDILKQKEQLYDSLFNYNIDGILVLDLKGNVIDANPAIEKITGYTVKELLDIELISSVAIEDIERKIYHCQKACHGEPQEYELSIFNKIGKQLKLVVKMIPIMSQNEIVGLFEIIKDVTEAKQMEMMMHRSDKLSVIGELAAGVAHEIRNPLTTLKGFLDLLSPEINSKYASLMQSELERINTIVNEFLLLAKPKVVNFKMNRISEIISNVIFMLEPQSHLSNIQVIPTFNDHGLLVNSDENQLKQVFINIIKNAMEAMPNGGNIYINVNNKNNQLRIQVQDEGCGIPKEKLSKLGDPFYTTKLTEQA